MFFGAYDKITITFIAFAELQSAQDKKNVTCASTVRFRLKGI